MKTYKNSPNKRYITSDKDLKQITMYQVNGVRNILQPGDKVKAEIWKQVSYGDRDGQWVITTVTIKKKYPFIALTDKGSITWKNITLNNQHLIREAAVVWMI